MLKVWDKDKVYKAVNQTLKNLDSFSSSNKNKINKIQTQMSQAASVTTQRSQVSHKKSAML
jgi:hypothetical protein